MQLLVEREKVHVVCEIEGLFGTFVDRAPVCAVSICVVLPPVLYAVVEEAES